ncbi:branched-chain amino acid transport system substrate-binding protein [Dethiosulfatibacter aminovorans DSM 17477]|uniref:Branched-chain amino acid transport system substrate-binding protein n=1 Tax=Dethiosulfatibacter aminovorans DSM 17477 TaxID=1121476 RepID=A0A1M6M210_9FIRM|nr:ABC transporter substrate-binding protein [Dethiosulfatibacter aminovorans]SHJ77353.1 branched-chain amino acid transport system substrate-binding protein [Dethiosulfatibacter aminovorans DSM 17477]
MKKNVVVILICVALIVVLIAGCQPKAKNEGPKSLKIGVAAPITGNWSEYGYGFEVATAIAAEEINESGGINGMPIELVVMNSKGDTKEATAIARKFSEDEEILAVVGDFSSTCCMAAAPIYEEGKLVQLSPTATDPDYAGLNEYMFGIMGVQSAEGPFVTEYLLGKYVNADNVAVIYLNNDWGVSASRYVIKTAKEQGINIVAEESHVDGQTDFSTLLTKVQQANPDTICLITFYNECASIANQIAKMNWDVQITALGPGASEQIIELGGENVEGLLASTPFFAIDDGDSKLSVFKRHFELDAGFSLNVHSACAYDALNMIAAAMENCDEITRENIRDELAGLRGFTGITGPIEFQPSGDIIRKFLIVGIENGSWTIKADYDYADELE